MSGASGIALCGTWGKGLPPSNQRADDGRGCWPGRGGSPVRGRFGKEVKLEEGLGQVAEKTANLHPRLPHTLLHEDEGAHELSLQGERRLWGS